MSLLTKMHENNPLNMYLILKLYTGITIPMKIP